MVETNETLVSLDLSNNNVRNKFVLALISHVKLNTRIRRIRLANNIVNPKHIRCLEILLALNRSRTRRSALPRYKSKVESFRLPANELTRAQQKMAEVSNAFRVESAYATSSAEELRLVEQHETGKTRVFVERKAERDKEWMRIDAGVQKVEQEREVRAEKGEKEVERMRGKIEGTKRDLERMTEECIRTRARTDRPRNEEAGRERQTGLHRQHPGTADQARPREDQVVFLYFHRATRSDMALYICRQKQNEVEHLRARGAVRPADPEDEGSRLETKKPGPVVTLQVPDCATARKDRTKSVKGDG